MMTYVMFILSIIFVLSFLGVSSKPSPVYGGLSLIVAGGVGCGVVVNFGGPFLGLMVFLIYLGGMLVVFGYTAAMAIEEYPEAWVSNIVVLGAFVIGMVMELLLMLFMVKGEGLGVAVEFNNKDDWMIYEMGGTEILSGEIMGVSALYSYGAWFVVVTGWSLLICVVIIMEVTRGN
uniref:NADH-ubiquinone oxidoreductase chain 6 n=1 Tax=Phataginus tetradactyla TaxID=73815 RepID=Q8LWT1_PHATE|nr:NADH dehydrogenase subunit 6 [Phataginus tetradactyla]CAD13273.1 NADH dehydrogenase subunit 6 [Phataginus tetradactyla]